MKEINDFVNGFLGNIWGLAFRAPLSEIPVSVWVWLIGVGLIMGIVVDYGFRRFEYFFGYEFDGTCIVEICGFLSVFFQVAHIFRSHPLAANLIASTLVLFFSSVAVGLFLYRRRTKGGAS